MIRYTVIRTSFICLSVTLLSACASIAPSSQRLSTQPLDQGQFDVSLGTGDSLYVSGMYGVTDHWDIGVALESGDGQIHNVWTKYNVLHNPQGFSVAGALGAFKGDSNYKQSGAYAGVLLGYAIRDTLELNASYYHYKTDYTPLPYTDYNGQGYTPEAGNDWGGINSYNKEDLSEIGMLSISLGFKMRSYSTFHVGVSCKDYYHLRSEWVSSSRCVPVLGVSFQSR